MVSNILHEPALGNSDHDILVFEILAGIGINRLNSQICL
jgi:hypothetical protein